MCGIVGIWGRSDVALNIYRALILLQHRGQDAAGIAVSDSHGSFQLRKSLGYVRSVFRQQHFERLKGNIGIGHVRYPTAGSTGNQLTQPFYVNAPHGIALAHNGNLVNVKELREFNQKEAKRHLMTNSDSELMINLFAHHLQVAPLNVEGIFNAVSALHKQCQGAYACVALIANHGLLGWRDPRGIRPLILGQSMQNEGEYMFASESAALTSLGFQVISDVAAGEAILIDWQGQIHRQQCAEKPELTPCIFEHVYFSRPDSIMDEIYVYKARLRQGIKLAKRIEKEWHGEQIDVVVPIPDTSRVAAQSLAEELNIKLREGLIKNRYVGRTFIMNGQKLRQDSVKNKLNIIDIEVRGKNVLLVDDSIVRGTTSSKICQMVRAAGANKIFFASVSPPVRYPNIYGIDMPAEDELIARYLDEKEIAKKLNIDYLIYQTLEDLIDCSKQGNPAIVSFETSIFDRNYKLPNLSDAYFTELAHLRGQHSHPKPHL